MSRRRERRDRDEYGRRKRSYSRDDESDEEAREARKRHKREREEEERGGRGRQIDFERYRSKLAKIFFRTEDFIQFRSKEYNEFWQFLYKYQAVEKAKMERKQSSSSSSSTSVFPSEISSLGISSVYDKTLNLSFQLEPQDSKDLLNRISFQVLHLWVFFS